MSTARPRGYDPTRDGPYGEWLKAKGIGSLRRTHATQDQVLEDSRTRRTVRDQAGNDVTEWTDERGGYHCDVTINLP